MEIREFLKEYLQDYLQSLLLDKVEKKNESQIPYHRSGNDISEIYIQHSAPQTEVERKIVDVLEQYVRPAVEQDGGMVVFRSYQDGIVRLLLRGACSGCPSSILTLKAGIEALLKKFVPEVKEVVSEG
jgi:Fe-S cluster biogenesis protein NfuA